MRKSLFAVTTLLIFTLAGCDLFAGDLPAEALPVLELVGDIDVTIGLNEEYVDPGVTLIGDYDLEITTESTLDITTYGIYYIYYTIDFDGLPISAERRIRVVPDTEKAFNIQLSNISMEVHALTFSVSIDDEAGNLKNAKASLYYLDTLIEEYPISDGVNILQFDDLDTFTYYTLELTGTYIDNGVEYSLNDYNVGAKTTTIPLEDYPRLEVVGDAEIHLEVGDTYVEQGATIIGDQVLTITTESNVDTTKAGTYIVFYSILFDETTIYAHRTVIVDPSDSPDFGITITATETNAFSLGLSVSVNDPDGLISGAYGVLYLGDDEIGRYPYTNGITEMTFNYLLADTTYHFALEGSYLQEGSLENIGDYSLDVSTLEVNDLQPIIVLIGDSVIDININTPFLDPGAAVMGYPDAVIDVQSYLDTSVPDTYIINYSTVINGMYYFVTRTVNVINPGALDFNVTLSLDSVTETSVIYSLNIGDNFDELTRHTAQLYDGATFVAELQFSEGSNTLEFNNLDPEKTYTVTIIGEYMLNGILTSIGEYQLDATTLDATAPVISLTSYTIGIENLDTVINVFDPHSQIISMEAIVYDLDYQEMEWMLAVGNNPHNFDYLGHEINYRLVVEYTYIPYGESTPIDVSIKLLDFTTLTPPKPDLDDLDCTFSDTSITCDADWDETGFTINGYFAQVWDNDTYRAVWFVDGNARLVIEDLEPETDYLLIIFADYVVNDTSARYVSEITRVSAITLRPVVKTEPVIENIEYTYTPTSITVDFDVLDPTNAFTSGYIRVSNGWSTVESAYVVGHNTITFDTEIYPNDDYSLTFRMSYDLNETYPYVDDLMATFNFVTPPNIEFDTLATKEMYFTDDNIVLEINLINNDEVNIEFVTIDGVRYQTYAFPSNPEQIYIDMGVRDAGTYHFNLDNVGITVNGEEYLYNYDYELIMQVYVPGTIDPDNAEVLVLDITTDPVGGSSFVPISGDAGYEEATIDIYLHLENEYNLEVTALNIYGAESPTSFEIISPTLIRATITVDSNSNTLGLNYIEYIRNGETIHNTLEIDYYGNVYGYLEEDITEIYTLSDLQAMTTSGKYRLMNDIDLASAEWTPLGTEDDPFGGTFDGNGYTLSNFNITKNIGVGESNAYVGFFGYSGGFISDLTFHNVGIVVTSDDETVPVSVGILAGRQQSYSVQNVHVTGLSSISIDGVYGAAVGGLVGEYYEAYKTVVKDSSAYVDININGFDTALVSYALYVGGLIGYDYSGNVTHSHSTGNITITNTGLRNVYTGGLVGYLYGPTDSVDKGAYIFNSYSGVDINSSGNATGGLLGAGFSIDSVTILYNTFSTGDINGQWGDTSGLVGSNYNGYIYNSFSTGDVNATYGSVAAIYADDSFSWNFNSRMVNVYNWEDQLITKEYYPVSGSDTYIVQIIDAPTAEFNSIDFYTDILGYNEYFFDFSNLNVELGDLPTS